MSQTTAQSGRNSTPRHIIWTLERRQWTPVAGMHWASVQPQYRLCKGSDGMSSLGPPAGFYVSSSGILEDAPDRRHVRFNGMNGQENRPSFHRCLESFGTSSRDAGPFERRGDAACDMTSGLAQTGRERPGGNDGSDTRQHEGDRGDQMARQLSKPGGGPGILDLGSRRTAHILGVARLLVVIAADDRNLLASHRIGMETARRLGGLGRTGKHSNNERVRHRGILA